MHDQVATGFLPKLNRWAGFLYLAIIVFGIWGEGLIRAGAIIAGDPAATAANILGSDGVFFVSIAGDIIMVLADIALAILLLVLFRPVSKTLAIMAAAFRMTQAVTITISLLALWAGTVLVYCNAEDIGIARDLLDSAAFGLIEMHGVGYSMGLIFFGINCLITGYLIIKSGFVPKLLGVGIALSGAVYLIGSTSELFIPAWVDGVQMLYAVPLLAETAFCMWLLFRGVQLDRWQAAHAAPQPA